MGLTAWWSGCARSPFADDRRADQSAERALRRLVVDAAARELAEADRHAAPVVTRRESQVDLLKISPDLLPELDSMAGPAAHDRGAMPLGEDLLGRPSRSVAINLQRAIHAAVENNIAVQFARLSPAIGEAQVAAAEAAFDWTLFSNLQATKTDSPRLQTGFGGIPSGPTSTVQDSITNTTGFRRTLVGGGRLTIQQELSYTNDASPGQTTRPDPAGQLQYAIQYDQPLLRGSGSEVTQAEIRLARNAERNSVQTFKRDLLRVASDTERAYWQLVAAQHDLLILQRLVERGEEVRRQLEARRAIDANQAQIADATARIARRRTDVTRAQTNLKTVSDRIKVLMNDPDLPVGSEVILLPLDRAVDEPIQFSLVDSIRASVLHRPEVQQAILAIDDASIRRVVADNAREPDLSLRLQARLSALEDSLGESYREVWDARFVDYIVGAVLEVPVGNRRAESDFRRRSLERMQTVIAYRNTVQQVTQEVKASIDRVVLNYKLIEQTRAGRIAAAESLRTLLVEKKTLQGITPERLDLELNRQEQLAQAEREEIQALTDYNGAIADLFTAMGTLLERNRIRLVVPTLDDQDWSRRD